MKKLPWLVLLLLTGCKSTQPWVKADGAEYTDHELNSALLSCDYKKRVSESNRLMLEANRSTQEMRANDTITPQNSDQQHRMKILERQIEQANSMKKKQSLAIAQEAYSCMQSKGFQKPEAN